MNYKNLTEPKKFKSILKAQAILDIIMLDKDEEWMRITTYYPNYLENVDMFKIDNGSGDDMFILFSEHGVIIKGFDHESILSPHTKDEFKVADGIYNLVPKKLLDLLKDKSIEQESVTFCIWRTSEDLEWNKGKVSIPKGEDDGKFLLLYINETPDNWKTWAEDYYEEEFDIENIKKIYSNEEITLEMIEEMNPERDSESALREIKKII